MSIDPTEIILSPLPMIGAVAFLRLALYSLSGKEIGWARGYFGEGVLAMLDRKRQVSYFLCQPACKSTFKEAKA